MKQFGLAFKMYTDDNFPPFQNGSSRANALNYFDLY